MIKDHAPAERHRVVIDHFSCVHGGIPLLASEVLFWDHHSFADEVGRGAGWNVGAELIMYMYIWVLYMCTARHGWGQFLYPGRISSSCFEPRDLGKTA